MRILSTWAVVASAAALLAAPRASLAQQADLSRVRQALPADAADRVARIVEEAEAAGVPAHPLVNKALEGTAKGVPADRIVSAVSSYASRLRSASGTLGGGAKADQVVAAADALGRGASPEAVSRLNREAGDGSAAAFVVLGDLVESGVPVDRAVEVVEEALRTGRTGADLLAVPGVVRRLVRQGTPPGLAARAVARTMAGRGPPEGVPPVELPPQAGGPPVPPGAGPPGEVPGQGKGDGPPDEPGPPGGEPPGGGGSGG